MMKKQNNPITKQNFAVIIRVEGANPNGSPEDGAPRRLDDDRGIITNVCLKSKFRKYAKHRLSQKCLYVKPEDNSSIETEVSNLLPKPTKTKKLTNNEIKEKVNSEFWDTRLMGAVVTGSKISVGIRGAVSIGDAISTKEISDEEISITKERNGCDTEKEKSSDTMGGSYYRIIKPTYYVAFGGINDFVANKNGATVADIEVFKESVKNMFLGDDSNSRPDGSMAVTSVVWWDNATNISPARLKQKFQNIVSSLDTESKLYDFDEIVKAVTATEWGCEVEVLPGY